MEKKYIIKLPENTHWIQWIMEGTKDHHPYMDFKQVEDITPYTEPDLEQIRKEAYEDGLKDSWEAARKIASDNAGRNYSIFGQHFTVEILNTHSASECIEKIRQYEQEQEEQKRIQVGDEIEVVSGKAVVVYVDKHKVRYVYSNGVYAFDYIDKVTKTGRHFPEIAEVLQKMKETEC